MSKIYIADYGLGKCKNGRQKKENILKHTGWQDTGFDTTIWKEVKGEPNIEKIKEELRNSIKEINPNCEVNLLIMCVDKCEVLGVDKDNNRCFGTNFIAHKASEESFS